jgi:hypothetical protein
VASVHVICAPVLDNLQCSPVALMSDVSRPVRTVTAEATWQLSPPNLARLVAPGTIRGAGEGDVDIDVSYQSKHAHVAARFSGDAPPVLLGMIHGRVFAPTERGLQPLAGVQLAVVDGANAGRLTSTGVDGGYELTHLVPEDLSLQATKLGYFPANTSAHLWAGDGTVSLTMRPLRRTTLPGTASVLTATLRSGEVDEPCLRKILRGSQVATRCG